MESRAGTFVQPTDYDLIVGRPGTDLGERPVSVYRADGELLIRYLPGVVTADLCREAWIALRTAAAKTRNRGTALGVKHIYPAKGDGTVSRVSQVPLDKPSLRGVGSGIVGAFERASPARFPMCRLTAWSMEHPDRFAAALPFIRRVDEVFREECPERWERQMEEVRATHPAWRIHGTSFSTITVNKDFRTAIHKDVGDLREGFGVMSALRAGEYEGCYTVWPAYGVGVDMRTGGVCLADVHEWHGNSVLVGEPRAYERISCVFYYRARMRHCKSPEDEVRRAATRSLGDPLWDPEELRS